MEPLLVINLKTYQQGTGKRAAELSRIAQKVSKEEDVSIAVAVQAPEIFNVSKNTGAMTLSQHVDNIDFGSNTGSIHPESVKDAGAVGTLLNHAEHSIPLEQVRNTLDKCKHAGLKTIVCVHKMDEVEKVKEWKPDYIAFEDPELIGTLKSISRMKPESVKEFAQSLEGSGITPLCGAGIANGEDVQAAKRLGTQGGIIATAVVKAEDPEQVMREMAQALKT